MDNQFIIIIKKMINILKIMKIIPIMVQNVSAQIMLLKFLTMLAVPYSVSELVCTFCIMDMNDGVFVTEEFSSQ